MARKPMDWPTGVEPVGEKLRIRFTVAGQRRCETLQLAQTAKGIQTAAGIRAQVISLHKHGMLTDDKYAELFPSSSYSLTNKTQTFGQYAQIWLNGVKGIPSTRRGYRGVIQKHWMPRWAATPIDQIRPIDCRKAVAETEWLSAGERNRAVGLASQIFGAAVADELIIANPMRVIKPEKEPEREIDPLTSEERDAVIAHMYQRFTGEMVVIAAFFQFAFFTGMRITELFALRWADIDFNQRTATVRSVLAEKEVHARTKTKKVRSVRLLAQAMAALETVKPWTMAKSEFVFAPHNSKQWKAVNGKHFVNTELTRYHFKTTLRKLGIRDRRQRDTRHTFATLALMDGAKPAFIAQQLGHSVQTLLKRYAKWVNSVDDWKEVEKLESGSFGTKLVQAQTIKLLRP